ncbi:hypothetical protein GCM10028826_19100 [Mucilaginibacter boryungensis]
MCPASDDTKTENKSGKIPPVFDWKFQELKFENNSKILLNAEKLVDFCSAIKVFARAF